MTTACTVMLEVVMTKDRPAFDCMADCVMASVTKNEAQHCADECPAFKRAGYVGLENHTRMRAR